jgi:hypothetical protein
MTSDIYYGFASKPFRDSLQVPSTPVRDKWFRPNYTVQGDGLEIVNGPNLFNRPLFAPGCRTLVTVGDRPALILWTSAHYPKPNNNYFGKPDWLGHLFVGLSMGGKSKWFHDFTHCRTHYHPGWVDYRLQDPMFPETEVRVEILPHSSGAVWLNVEMTSQPRAAQTPVLVWSHGCLGYTSVDVHQHYDPSASYPFTWDEPHLAANDQVDIQLDLAILRDRDDLANWVAVGSTPAPSHLLVVDVEKRLDAPPDELLANPAAARPGAAGRIALNAGTSGKPLASLIVNWGRNSDPAAAMKPLIAAGGERTAEAKAHFSERTGRIAIHTPDPELDMAFRFAVVGADGMWHPPGINHSPFSWPGLTTIFRIFYGLTACGDHERVASALALHCGVDARGRLKNLVSAVGQEPHATGYESYGSTVDMLWHHHLWSNDRGLLERWRPVVDQLIQYEERACKDSNGLFLDHLGFWCSDSFHYEEGCAVGTLFVWRMYMVRGWIAEALGEDAAPFHKRAAEIKALMLRLLWNEEGGFLYDSLGVDGRRKPTTIAPTVYHAIEYDFLNLRDAGRMFDWMAAHLLSPVGMIRVNDWFPVNWSHNVYSPNETGNAAVAAFRLRRSAAGYAMLRGIAHGTMNRALVPGAIMCMASSDGVLENGADFGDGVSLFLRAVIEGLFGVRVNRPLGLLRLEPNFPEAWDRAEVTLPDVGCLKYRRTPVPGGVRHSYLADMTTPLRVSASLPGGRARNVRVNGQPVEPAAAAGGEKALVELDIPAGLRLEISFDTTAAGSHAAVRAPAAQASITGPAATRPSRPSAKAHFEPMVLSGSAPIPFERAYQLFPGELVWNLARARQGQPAAKWGFVFDAAFAANPIELLATGHRIPFRVDHANILGFKKKHEDPQWKGFALDFGIGESLSVPVGKPAGEVCLLASGLCAIMTCHMPQVEIALEYQDGRVFRHILTAPGEFDLITQHTSVHPSVAIGWFGKQDELRDIEKRRVASGDPLFMINQRLHADVIRLPGAQGVLKRISFTPLQRHSGMVLYGISLAAAAPPRSR